MSGQELFWFAIGLSIFVLSLLAVREFVFLRRFPVGHKERAQGWFTLLMLVFAAGAVFAAGYFIDGTRRAFEVLLPAYPSARYAFEESDILHGTLWVYKTTDASDVVLAYYRTYAQASNIQFFEDEADKKRMSFALPSGNLFLTIEEVDGVTILFFTREGQVHMITR